MLSFTVLLALTGCKKVEAIPKDLDGVVHFLWMEMDDADDDTLAEGIVNLDAAMNGTKLAEAFDGSISRLSAEEVEHLQPVPGDPKKAAGIFLGNVIHCGLPKVTEIVTHPKQEQLYEGVYDSYRRDYHGDIDAFLVGDDDTLTWDVSYSASVLGASYHSKTQALLRRVRLEGADFDEAYMARFHAPQPARFEKGSNKSFTQDYQFEVYYSRKSGETLHAYAMWRQANWGTGFTSEDESVQRILLNNMEKWDKDTDEICAEGGP